MLLIIGFINIVIKWIIYCVYIYLYKFILVVKISLLCKKIYLNIGLCFRFYILKKN